MSKPVHIRTTMMQLVVEAIATGHNPALLEFRMAPEAFAHMRRSYGDEIPAMLDTDPPTFMGIPISTAPGHPVDGMVQLCDRTIKPGLIQLRIA